MNRILGPLKIFFLAAFVVSVAGVFVYDKLWTKPSKACEKAKWWWDTDTRACARPVDIAQMTHRPLGEKRTPEQVEAARKRAGFHH